MKNYMKNMYSKLMALLTLLVVGYLTAAADNKVYISDFSIEAGEEKEIAINFDTDATDVIFLQGTINLPEGLTIVKNAYGKNKNAKADENRAEGFNAQLNGTTGKFSIVSTSGDPFTGNTGAVATFKVTATTALAPSSVIQITDLSTKPVSTVTTQDATVTCAAAAGEVNIMTADPTEISLAPGGTAEAAISLANETNELEGFSAHLTLPDGITAEIVPGSRTTGKINYSATSGNIFKVGTISGNDGVLFTIKLTAASSFVAPATIVLDEIALSTSDASSSIDLDNVVINVAAAAPEVNSMSADLTEVSLAPGLTAEVAVTLTNETNELEGFSAHLTLPDGITAEIIPGNRTTGKISYSAASGNIFKVGAISGNDGVLFTIKLTASETFAGSGTIVLDEIALSTSDASTSIDLDNVTINVKDISKDIFNDYKDTQKAAADALAQEGDSEAAQKIITDAKAAIDALTYDESKTLAENKAAVDAIIAPLADALAAQRAADQLAADKAAFDAYKTEQKAAADALAQEGDSEAAQKIITDAKAAIDALTYDESKTLAENKAAVDAIIAPLADALAAQRAADQLAADKAAFDAYKTEQKAAADALAQEGDSEAAQKIITDAKEAIDALTYDESKTLAENKAAVDAIIAPLADALAAQRAADQLAADKAAFDAYKTEQKAAADALAQEGDSEAAQKIITDAKEAIDALTYDESKTLAENKAAVDAIITKLQADLAAQREQEAQSTTPIRGDVTGSGEVTADDVTKLIDDILSGNLPTDPNSTEFFRYDANADGIITVADVQAAMNLAVGQNADGSDKTDGVRLYETEVAKEALMSIQSASMGNGITRYTISLHGGISITGLQMDVVTTQSAMVISEQLVNNTTILRSNNLRNGTHRILGMLNSELTAEGEVVYVDVQGEGSVRFENVVLTNAQAQSIAVYDSEITGIKAITNGQTIENCYDLNGRKVNGQKGLVILNGKKVVLK